MDLLDILYVVSGMLILIFVSTVFYTLKERVNGKPKLNKDALRKFALQCSLSFLALIFACIVIYLAYLTFVSLIAFKVYAFGYFILMWIFVFLLYAMLNLFINLK